MITSMYFYKYFAFILLLLNTVYHVNTYSQGQSAQNLNIAYDKDLVIGLESQPVENQLGTPVFVRTDQEGNIYVADRSSMSIKVFDKNGTYLHNIGQRGRGPGELLEIGFMDITPDHELVVIDRLNTRYTFFSLDGEVLNSHAMLFGNSFLPLGTGYYDGDVIGLQLLTKEAPSTGFLEPLFHVYETNFLSPKYSFGKMSKLELESDFALISLRGRVGSIHVNENEACMLYAPGLYNGKIYQYCDFEEEGWQLTWTFDGVSPFYGTSYMSYSSVESAGDFPPVVISYRGGRFMGRVMSFDAGIYELNDGTIVHFFAEWKQGENALYSFDYVIDLQVQIFSKKGELLDHGTLGYFDSLGNSLAAINWKDDNDRFYLIGVEEGVPVIKRFVLDL
jgi:hypothetical protein